MDKLGITTPKPKDGKCPKCGATVIYDSNSDIYYCPKCGTAPLQQEKNNGEKRNESKN